MDEYIKKSDLKAELLRRDFYPAIVKSALETIPPADVVPRAEVDKTIAEWAYLHADTVNKLDNAKAEVERLEKEIKALLAFKDYFSDLYGHGLEIANWHENGELEYFDSFYESAVDEYEAELKKKYTGEE